MIITEYRSDPSNKNRHCMDEFCDDFSNLLTNYHDKSDELIIVGDFNFHMIKPNDPRVMKVNEILTMFELVQHVKGSTHKNGNTLDLIITRHDSLVTNCTISSLISDHNCILFNFNITKDRAPMKKLTYRKTKCIVMAEMRTDLNHAFSNVPEPGTVKPNEFSEKMKTDARQITTQLPQEVPHTSSPQKD